MKVKALKTSAVKPGDDLLAILDQAIPKLDSNAIVAVTSKIVSLCEGSVVNASKIKKETLIFEEADKYLAGQQNPYDVILTIKNNILIANAGIDESNGNGQLILWPKDPQQSANLIRAHLMKKHKLKNVGVIITDSITIPLRWGTIGLALAYSGFKPLRDYIGTPDIFGRQLKATKANVADAMAASAVLVMGEGAEQTPLAIISDLDFIEFTAKNPSPAELKARTIALKDDLYAPLLNSVHWQNN